VRLPLKIHTFSNRRKHIIFTAPLTTGQTFNSQKSFNSQKWYSKNYNFGVKFKDRDNHIYLLDPECHKIVTKSGDVFYECYDEQVTKTDYKDLRYFYRKDDRGYAKRVYDTGYTDGFGFGRWLRKFTEKLR